MDGRTERCAQCEESCDSPLRVRVNPGETRRARAPDPQETLCETRRSLVEGEVEVDDATLAATGVPQFSDSHFSFLKNPYLESFERTLSQSPT